MLSDGVLEFGSTSSLIFVDLGVKFNAACFWCSSCCMLHFGSLISSCFNKRMPRRTRHTSFFDSNISRSSVATRLRRGGIFAHCCCTLLQIYRWLCQWKNCENRSIFDEVMTKTYGKTYGLLSDSRCSYTGRVCFLSFVLYWCAFAIVYIPAAAAAAVTNSSL